MSISELTDLKSRDKVPFSCEHCHTTFYRTKNLALRHIKGTKLISCCSQLCSHKHQEISMSFKCTLCQTPLTRTTAEVSKTNFCSHSCRAKYWNKNRKWSNSVNRSKLERWIESKLQDKYPSLEIIYNSTTAIDAELDIYIPSLKLAVELNGIFHYEPIFGMKKLLLKQTNDSRKFQACLENHIDLCIIDTTSQTYFKEHSSQKFLTIIINIIEEKLRAMRSTLN